jgi:high affinity Mn2+ porin
MRACLGIHVGAGIGLLCLTLPGITPASAQQAPTPTTPPENSETEHGYHPGQKGGLPYEFGFQATLIDQQLFKFHSPYEGPNSLRSRSENEKTDTYTLYLGARLTRGLEVYVDPEMARGNSVSEALGLAGFTNGDVIRQGGFGLAMDPYLARYLVRYTVATGHGQEKIEPGENQIAGMRPAHRLVVTAGKVGTTDIFDVNSYANSTRTQFMNWALINSAAYDYAADTRGYSKGIALEWVHPDWALRLGRFQMPTVANGPDLQKNLERFHGDQIELELHPHLLRHKPPFVVRLMGYANVAHAGNYRDALALARQTGTTPDITMAARNSAVKVGFNLNFEQALGDDGTTGLFGRYGWNDGATESFAYTEAERSACLGFQLSGMHWRRKDDHLAIALVQNDLTAAHRDYLAAGGLGFILGDGKLNYGSEQIVETYYNYQLARPLTLSLDYQFINNPGYNRDRGPVSVLSFRAHLEF